MTKVGLIKFLLLFVISTTYGQKVKYKDIYALLSTKQFEQAEPFLKRYLKETTDNPNAYLFMGNIYQEKSVNNDVLKQTDLAIANIDSAIMFYDKAYKTIDEREVKKNKDYYQNYSRRDLRTGEFGVSLSDIRFDLEKRMDALREKKDRLKNTKIFFNRANGAYSRANEQFVQIQGKFSSLNELYLRSGEEMVNELADLASRYDSCVKNFDLYKTSLSGLGKTGYNQKLSVKAISDFKIDGRSGADFLSDNIQIWDYKKFADETKAIVVKEIIPMRANLVSYDKEINKLGEKLRADSVSVRSDLTKLIDKLLLEQLKKFDATPLPMVVFGLKTTDLAYKSLVLEHKPFRDSADLHFQINRLKSEVALLRKLDSIAALVPGNKLQERVLNYSDFVKNTFNDASSLADYIERQRAYAANEMQKKKGAMDRYLTGLNYIVDGADSIPLSTDVITVHQPLATTPEQFTVGVSLKDTTQLAAYFYTISASRRPDVKAYFPLDKNAFRKRTLPVTKALTYSDPGGQIFYVLLYSERPVKNKIPATLAKIYRSDGLAWKMDYALAFAPNELVYSSGTGELVIGNGEQRFIVDKNGKAVK